MPKPLPKAIKVGHLDFKVVVKPEVVHEDGDKCHGLTRLEDPVIEVADYLGPQVQAETMIHELLHACYEVWKISPRWGEEKTVNALAPAICSILRDNPKFVTWLKDALLSEEVPPQPE